MTTVRELVIEVNFKGNAAEESKSLVGGFADVKAGLELVVGAVKFAASAIASFTTDVAAMGDDIAKNAKNIGITAEALQEFDFAAKISGASAREVQVSIQRMGKGLNDARQKGTGPFADSLEQLGVKIGDLEGLSPDETFTELADAISRVEDPMTKAALAQDLFGRGGKTLLPLINEGRSGIEKLRKEFKELGGAFTNDGAAAAEEFQDAILRMETVINSVKVAVGVELLPIIQEIIDEIRIWAQENSEAVKKELVGFIKDLTANLRKLGPTLKAVLPLIEDFALFMSEAIAETGFLIEHIDDLDKTLTDDFGPAWTIIRELIEASLLPFSLMSDAFDDLATGSDKLSSRLGGLLKPLSLMIRGIRSLTGAVPEGEGREGKPKEKARFLGEGGGVVVLEGAERLKRAKTSTQLKAISADESEAPAVRALANERLQVGQAEDLAFVTGLVDTDVAFVQAQIDAANRLDPTGRRPKAKGGKKKEKPVTDEELFKLISKASAEGVGLDSVLGGRKLEGGAPPVIAVNIINNEVAVQASVDISVSGVPGESAEDIALRIDSVVQDRFQTEFRAAIEEIDPVVSR